MFREPVGLGTLLPQPGRLMQCMQPDNLQGTEAWVMPGDEILVF